MEMVKQYTKTRTHVSRTEERVSCLCAVCDEVLDLRNLRQQGQADILSTAVTDQSHTGHLRERRRAKQDVRTDL